MQGHRTISKKDVVYPRVLVISNNCFSKTDSNGRTLQNFFVGWPKENLAQFYIQSFVPDFTVCENYFRVTDGEALRAFLRKGPVGTVPVKLSHSASTSEEVKGKKHSRTALTMLLRELVWNSRRWYGETFQNWLNDFAPQIILLQAGDCGFMFKLAEDIARQYNASIVIYNSEGYYFKKLDYFRARGIAHWCYPIFRRFFCRQFRSTIQKAAFSIYNCDILREDYEQEFDLPSYTIYTATDMQVEKERTQSSAFTAAYLGNLGVGRHLPLSEIACALQDISPDLYLDVYGKIPNESVQAAFDASPGIRYRGFVSYEKVAEVMQTSTLLVHCEAFEHFYREDLKYAFSTKIADSLASGTCFLLYAPDEMACTQYLLKKSAAWVVSDPKRLRDTLQILVEDAEVRKRYLTQAATVVAENHKTEKNAQKFQELLCNALER